MGPSRWKMRSKLSLYTIVEGKHTTPRRAVGLVGSLV